MTPQPESRRGEGMRKQEVSPAGAGVCGANAPSAAAVSAGLVERVAAVFEQAMGSPASGPVVWSAEKWAAMQEQARFAARAAIQAMREPTEEMARAGFFANVFEDFFPCCDSQFRTARVTKTPMPVWLAMIDAALGSADGPLPPQPRDPPAADDGPGMTKDEQIQDLTLRLSLANERPPSPKARKESSGEGGDWRSQPEAP